MTNNMVSRNSFHKGRHTGGKCTCAVQHILHSAEEDHARLLPGLLHGNNGGSVCSAGGRYVSSLSPLRWLMRL